MALGLRPAGVAVVVTLFPIRTQEGAHLEGLSTIWAAQEGMPLKAQVHRRVKGV